MNRHIIFAATALAVVSSTLVVLSADAFAQEKQRVSYKVAAANTKYTQQHAIDVGDVPGHQVRIYEIHREYGKDGPVIGGERVVDQWTRASTDFTDLNGAGITYNVFVLGNGDRFFTRSTQLTESIPNADGSAKSTTYTVGEITGGTGKYRNIRGITKSVSAVNIKEGIVETQFDVEYWMDK
jgi:hypothetical protein